MEIKSAKYFTEFGAMSQDKQLEFVNDSRQQIDELIGEVKFTLNNSENIPIEIKERINIFIEEISSEQIFSRLNGLKQLLDSLFLLNADEETINEFTERNQISIKEFINQLLSVEVTRYAFTVSQFQEWLREHPMSPSMLKISYTLPTYKPFQEYDKLIIECINKISKNEKNGFFAEDLTFKTEEIDNPSKWLLRAKQSKNAVNWILTYEALLSFIKDIHDGKVVKAKSEITDDIDTNLNRA